MCRKGVGGRHESTYEKKKEITEFSHFPFLRYLNKGRYLAVLAWSEAEGKVEVHFID